MIEVEHTIGEKVLLAALELEQADTTPFSAETLVVAAWRQFPATFGLKGFADQFPDSNCVLAGLMGKRGLVSRGWLDRKGAKLYALTREGRELVRRMLGGEAEKPPAPACNGHASAGRAAASAHDALLRRLFATRAWGCRDHRERLNFRDAMDFLGVGGAMTAGALNGQMKHQSEALQEARAASTTREAWAAGAMILSDGRCVPAWELEQLVDLQTWLCKRFASHLKILAGRKAVRQ